MFKFLKEFKKKYGDNFKDSIIFIFILIIIGFIILIGKSSLEKENTILSKKVSELMTEVGIYKAKNTKCEISVVNLTTELNTIKSTKSNEKEEQIKPEKEEEQKVIEENIKKQDKLGISYDELIYDISYLKSEKSSDVDGLPRYFIEDTESGVMIEVLGEKDNITSTTIILPGTSVEGFGTFILYLKNLLPGENILDVINELNEGILENGESYTKIYGNKKFKYEKSIVGLMLTVKSVNVK